MALGFLRGSPAPRDAPDAYLKRVIDSTALHPDIWDQYLQFFMNFLLSIERPDNFAPNLAGRPDLTRFWPFFASLFPPAGFQLMSVGGPTTPILSKPKKFTGRRTKKKRFPDRFVHGKCTGFTHITEDEEGGITSTNHPTCRIAGTCYGFARYRTSFSNQRRNET